MNIQSPETIKNNQNFSTEQAWEMFSILFENKENQLVVAELFKWLLWSARQQKVEETIKIAKWWIEELKNTIV